MMPDLRTVTIARDIAEEETADAYDALSGEILDLREEIEGLRREVGAMRRGLEELKRGVLDELERLREGLG